MRRLRSPSAFTLVEVVIAMGLMMAITAAVFAVLDPGRGIFQAQPEVQDLQQRLRIAVDVLQKDLIMAGAGTYVGPLAGPLHHYVAPVRPYRAGESGDDAAAGLFFRGDTVSIVYVPSTAAQAEVESIARAGELTAVRVTPNCGAGLPDRVCGFDAGVRVLLFDRTGRSEVASVVSVEGLTVNIEGRGPAGDVDADAGAMLTGVAAHTYSWNIDATTGTPRLTHYDGRRTTLPIVDHVVRVRFEYYLDPSPPALLPGVDLTGRLGPWTTYGPPPPPLEKDDARDSWGSGENCVFAVVDDRHVPRLAPLGPAAGPVWAAPAMLTDGPWCPDATAPGRFDADLLRIRRVGVTLRVEAAPASLRGPVGPLFARGGSSTSALMRVPDQELRFDVTPRNMNGGQ